MGRNPPPPPTKKNCVFLLGLPGRSQKLIYSSHTWLFFFRPGVFFLSVNSSDDWSQWVSAIVIHRFTPLGDNRHDFLFPSFFLFRCNCRTWWFFFFCSSSVTMSEMLITAHWHERHLEIFFWVNRRHAKHLRKKFIWLAKVFFFKRKKFKANDQKLRKLSTWFLLIFYNYFTFSLNHFKLKNCK